MFSIRYRIHDSQGEVAWTIQDGARDVAHVPPSGMALIDARRITFIPDMIELIRMVAAGNTGMDVLEAQAKQLLAGVQ